MNGREKAAVFSALAQHAAVRILQTVAVIVAAVAALKYGLAAILIGGLAFVFFGMARPGPSEHLDRVTGRGKAGPP